MDDTYSSQDQLITGGHNSPELITAPLPPLKQGRSNRPAPCKFFGTKHGCRAGNACVFAHDAQSAPLIEPHSHPAPGSTSLAPTTDGNGSTSSSVERGNQPAKQNHTASQLPHRPAVSRPIPSQQLANPREYNLNLIKKRFSPTVREDDGATILVFKLAPSDPDFPFELPGLSTILRVPKSYPSARPSIRVDNAEMERGYQINVERGFDDLVVKHPTKTLLALMNELDKNLENYLTSQKATTITFIANAEKSTPKPQPVSAPTVAPPNEIPVQPMKKSHTAQQLNDARSRREAELRQLEARLGRQPSYSKSSDGLLYNIPLQVPKAGRLPVSLQSVKDVTLVVPKLYPLEACTIRLREGSKEAELVELAFERRTIGHPELTLMAHINSLSQNLQIMAQEIKIEKVEASGSTKTVEFHDKEEMVAQAENAEPQLLDQDRPHIQIIPRPPEWSMAESEDDDSDSSELESSESDPEEGGAELDESVPGATTGPERGILLTFPLLELYSIELLQISSLSLTIKCERCKDTMDVLDVKPSTSSESVSRIVESCKKCASSLSIVYRSEPMHTNSIRAGFLDLEGCTVVDLLPSHFQPTCSECSTTFGKPGIVSVRGETSMAMCRECHKKMTFRLPEVKFLTVSSAERPNRPLPRKKPKENLGIVAGTELPRRGRCRHYAKSYRWFRFSCCGKVYACDRCHDASEEHPTEHANRMLCGFCSREQNYRPEDCAFCRVVLVGKHRGGFWEGGKGTRDKSKMSRKDPRKYKRRGGGAVGGKAK